MPERTHMPIEETFVYSAFADLSDEIWDEVMGWKDVPRHTVGTQLIRAIDSVGANLVERDGRFGVGDGIQFFVIARASAREAAFWLRRCRRRKLIQEPRVTDYLTRLEQALRALNALITYRRSKGKFKVEEESAIYGTLSTPPEYPIPPPTEQLGEDDS